MGKAKTFVTVKFRQDGVHYCPGADDYLKHPHRHEFHFTVWLEVFHDDSEVEFIALKERLQEYMRELLEGRLVLYSCENIAELLVKRPGEMYHPDRAVRVWVEEDGENGGCVEAG